MSFAVIALCYKLYSGVGLVLGFIQPPVSGVIIFYFRSLFLWRNYQLCIPFRQIYCWMLYSTLSKTKTFCYIYAQLLCKVEHILENNNVNFVNFGFVCWSCVIGEPPSDCKYNHPCMVFSTLKRVFYCTYIYKHILPFC